MSTAERTDYTITLDDDPLVHRTIEAATGLKSLSFSSGETFRSRSERYDPIAVFVDIHLGLDDSGLDLIPMMRQRWPYCPIIVVTAGRSGEGIGQALAAGANDYIKKPLDPVELTARLHARSIELTERSNREIVTYGDIHLNLSLNEIKGASSTSYLSHSDMRLLAYMVQSKGIVVTREELKRRIWGHLKVTDNALDKKLYEIRQALKEVSASVRLKAAYGKGLSLVVSKTNEKNAA